jgi:hypothetical protein
MTEIWKPIIIDNIESNYEVSDIGNVRVKSTKKLRSLCIREYIVVTLFYNNMRKNHQVHVLVATAFVPNDVPERNRVNHINHNCHDNHAYNLEWVTHAENIKHAHQKEGRKSTKKPILRYDLDKNCDIILNSVKEYDCVNSAITEFGSHIHDCLGGRSKTAYGHYWAYKNEQLHKVPMDQLDMSIFQSVKDHPNFLVSNDGRVYNKSRQAFLSPRYTGQYLSVVLDEKHYCIHVLVINHFSQDTPSQVVNHKNGDKTNNHINNLEYLTHAENIQHAYDTGLKRLNKVLQFDRYDDFLCEYASASEASTILTGNPKLSGHIGNSCKDETFTKMSGGYKWRYKTQEVCEKYNLNYESKNESTTTTTITNKAKECVRARPVLEFDKAGNFIAEHESITMVARKLNKKVCASISESCKDPNFKKTSAGSKWRYKTPELAKELGL